VNAICCPLCASGEVKIIDTSLSGSVTSDFRYLDHVFEYMHCENCGYIFREQNKEIDNKEYYTHGYELQIHTDKTERMIFEIEAAGYADYLADYFSEHLENSRAKTFLDIGAGKGSLVESVHNSFPDLSIFAVEPSRAFNNLKEKKFLMDCYNSFFCSADFDGKFFDYITLIEVLEHVLSPRKFLKDIKNIMREDSLLMISVPNVSNDKYDFLSPDHISRFTAESATNLFKTAGFEIVKSNIFQNSATMLFIVKKGKTAGGLKRANSSAIIKSALDLIYGAIEDAKKIASEKTAMYGQGLILDYLIGQKIIKLDNIVCIIDDNETFKNKKWKGVVGIVSLNIFLDGYRNVPNIFLAMNECYHSRVMDRIPDNYKIWGVRR